MLLSKEVISKNTVGYGLLSREKLSNHSIFGPSYAPDPFTKVFTSSQTYTIPDGVDKLDVTVVGGGNGGQNNQYSGDTGYSGAGGGGGYVINQYDVAVTPGSSMSVVVGAGGAVAGVGGQSKFGTIQSQAMNAGSPQNGGSGGGAGGAELPTYLDGKNGGSDGSAGVNQAYRIASSQAGSGQNTTTRGINDVLYAGGGGGAGMIYGYPQSHGIGGSGGAGGGGNGQWRTWGGVYTAGTAGLANSGGGGGGGTYNGTGYTGGSGVVIIKWKG